MGNSQSAQHRSASIADVDSQRAACSVATGQCPPLDRAPALQAEPRRRVGVLPSALLAQAPRAEDRLVLDHHFVLRAFVVGVRAGVRMRDVVRVRSGTTEHDRAQRAWHRIGTHLQAGPVRLAGLLSRLVVCERQCAASATAIASPERFRTGCVHDGDELVLPPPVRAPHAQRPSAAAGWRVRTSRMREVVNVKTV